MTVRNKRGIIMMNKILSELNNDKYMSANEVYLSLRKKGISTHQAFIYGYIRCMEDMKIIEVLELSNKRYYKLKEV